MRVIALGALPFVAACACGTAHPALDGAPLDGEALDAFILSDAGDAGVDVDSGSSIAASFYELCVRLSRARCDGNIGCCTIPERRYESCADVAGMESYCRDVSGDPALSDGSLEWQRAEAEEYVSSVEARAPGCEEVDRSAELEDFLRGTQTEGETCTPFDSNTLGQLRCREPLRCELTGDNENYIGICGPPGVEGDSCMNDCAEGFWCNRRLRMLTDPPFVGRCELMPDSAEECVADKACPSYLCLEDVCSTVTAEDSWCSQRN